MVTEARTLFQTITNLLEDALAANTALLSVDLMHIKTATIEPRYA